MKKLGTLLLCISSWYCSAQFSLHLGAQLNTPVGLNAKPYNDPFLGIMAMGGVGIGYRIIERLEVRAFANIGSSDKDDLADETPSTSRVTEAGLKPQLTLWTHSKKVFHFDVGIPFSYMNEEVQWTDALAFGQDQAELLRMGIAPALRWYYEKSGIIFQLAFHFNYDHLLNAERKIFHSDYTNNELHTSPNTIQEFNMGMRFTLGYSF